MTLIIIGGSRLLFPPQQDLSVGLFRDQKVQTNLQGNSDFQLLVRECCILLFDCQLLSDWSFTHAGSTDCSVLLPHFKVSDGSRCIFPPVRFERVVQLCKDSLAVKIVPNSAPSYLGNGREPPSWITVVCGFFCVVPQSLFSSVQFKTASMHLEKHVSLPLY